MFSPSKYRSDMNPLLMGYWENTDAYMYMICLRMIHIMEFESSFVNVFAYIHCGYNKLND